jgi:hypothetical protein
LDRIFLPCSRKKRSIRRQGSRQCHVLRHWELGSGSCA